MRAFRRFTLVLSSSLLGSLIAACAPGPTTVSVNMITTGDLSVQVRAPIRNHWIYPAVSGQSFNTGVGDELVYHVPTSTVPDTDPLASTARLTVEQEGLTTIALEQWEQETGSGLFADSWLRKQAFFVLSVPAGATIELPFADDTDPLEVQLKIDYDADGTVDTELAPLVVAEAENLEGERPKVEPVVGETPEGHAIVSFTSAVDSPNPITIYYSIYPGDPQIQIYSEPLVVQEGSFILYGAVGPTGTRQPTRELEILGGIADDVWLEVYVDGVTRELVTTAPGQSIEVTFEGHRQKPVKVEIGPITGGIQHRNQASLTILSPDGTVLRQESKMGVDGIGENRWSDTLDLPADGVYTIVIDPRLANLVSTTVTVSQAQ